MMADCVEFELFRPIRTDGPVTPIMCACGVDCEDEPECLADVPGVAYWCPTCMAEHLAGYEVAGLEVVR